MDLACCKIDFIKTNLILGFLKILMKNVRKKNKNKNRIKEVMNENLFVGFLVHD